MTLEPTRDEWMAARARVREAVPTNYSVGMDELVHAVTTAALGPCPAEPEQIIGRLADWIEDTNPGVSVNRQTGLVVT